jgi:hypothetical protein
MNPNHDDKGRFTTGTGAGGSGGARDFRQGGTVTFYDNMHV